MALEIQNKEIYQSHRYHQQGAGGRFCKVPVESVINDIAMI